MALTSSFHQQTDRIPEEGQVTEATRHLCEGVYLDEQLRREVIYKVHNDPYHRVAPSYGFDLVPVVEHAWRAWALQTSRQVCVLAVLAISLTSNAPASIMAVSGIGLWYLARRMLRTGLVVLRLKVKVAKNKWMRRKYANVENDDLREQVRLLVVCAGGCAVLVVVPEMIASFLHLPLTDVLPGAGLLLLLIAVVTTAEGAFRQLALISVHRAKSLRPRRLTKRQQVIDLQQDHTYVVYRHDTKKPFVGSGLRVYQWQPPLVVQLRRHGERGTGPHEVFATPFKAHELIDHLKNSIAPIGDPTDPDRMLGFEVHDRLYVDETNLLSARDCLFVEPTDAEIAQIIDNPHDTTHHYLEIRVTDNRELVVTAFLRVLIQGRSLTVDFVACALTGTPSAYRVLNTINATRRGSVARSALGGLRDLPREVMSLWRLIEIPFALLGLAWSRKDRSLTPRRWIMIGSRRGLREINALPWEDAHLDKAAVARKIKILEECLLTAIKEFLQSRGVDASIFEERVTKIINEGVISFGQTNMSHTAVGQNATVQSSPNDSGVATGGTSATKGEVS